MELPGKYNSTILWQLPAIFAFAFFYVSASALSPTWIFLLLVGLCFAAGAIWLKDIQKVLFFGFIFSCSISISKALIVEGGIYTPGLSITLSDCFSLPLFCLWFFHKKIIRGESIYWSKLHTFPLLFLLWLWTTVLISEDTLAGFLMCVSYTKYFLLFVLLADFIKKPEHVRLVLYAFALALCVHYLMALMELVIGDMVVVQGAKTTDTGTKLVFENAGGVHAFRPSGFMGHPNALADLLVFLLPPMLILLVLGKKYTSLIFWNVLLVVFAISILILLMTLSRAGWISFACASLYLLYFGYRAGVVKRIYIQRLFVTACVSALIAVMLFPTIYLRITESDQRSGESRIAMMYQAKLIIQNNPVMGVGIGGYNRAARANIPEYFAHLSPWFQDELLKGVVHNKYLLVMSETGVIGVTLFLLMLTRFVLAVPMSNIWDDPVLFSLSLGAAAGIFGQMVFYMFDHFYSDPRITICYVFFGILTALIKMQKQQNSSEQEAALPGSLARA